MSRKTFAAALIAPALVLAAAAPAWADNDRCRAAPRAEWRSIEDATAAVKAKGYTITGIERDDGCYEVKASAASGERVKLYVDPVSLEIVHTKKKRS